MTLDRDKIIKEVEDVLRERNLWGATESEVDFIIGASTVLHAIGLWPPPPRWIMRPMCGEKILGDEEE